MNGRQDALIEIASLARSHGLTLDDIAAALTNAPTHKAEKSQGILTRVFGYIGGVLVFAGLCSFAAMIWDNIGFGGHMILTLGAGFSAYLMGITCTKDPRFEKAATPLFLIAALLQPGGIMLLLAEYSRGGDPAYAILFMSLVMLVQQSFTFIALQRTVLAFTSILFGLLFFGVAFDLLAVPVKLNGLVMSTSVMCIAWALDNSRHRALSGICWFFGSAAFLFVAYDILEGKPYEVLFIGLTCGMIFLSTLARSRGLLTTATLGMLGYIGYFTGKYFENTLGFPVAMMMVGLLLIGFSALAVRINNKYIKQG